MTQQPLESLFYPKTIAVVGVSTNPQKIGHIVAKNIIFSNFPGELFCISKEKIDFFDKPTFTDLNEINSDLDLLIIAIPKPGIKPVIEQAVSKNLKNVVIITSGFKETGESGKAEELELVELAKKYKFNLLGPNCLGLLNLDEKHNYNGSFAKTPDKQGNISLISQSGALISSFLDKAADQGFGFNKVISLGNKSGLDENDFLEFLNRDEQTKVIAIYLEGIENGQEFIKLLSQIKKPVVILHPGKSSLSQAAISSHTGSIASNHRILQMYLSKLGIIQVENLTEFFSILFLLSRFDEVKKDTLAIITNAGGAGVITLDNLSETGLQLADLSPEFQDQLQAFLPSAASSKNPIDVLGDAGSDRYEKAIELCMSNSEIGSVLVILTPQVNSEIEKTAHALVDLSKQNQKPIIPVFIGGKTVDEAKNIFKTNKLPYFDSPMEALLALNKLNIRSQTNLEEEFLKNPEININSNDSADIQSLIDESKQKADLSLDYSTLKKISETFDLPLVKSEKISPEQNTDSRLKEIFEQFSKPVVAKVVSANVLHRTEKNMVKLGITDFEDLQSFCQEFSSEDIVVQEMIDKGCEIFIGIQNDAQFGLSLLIGSGGIYAEVLHDFALAPIPTNPANILAALQKTKAHQMLSGYRNKFFDIDCLVDTVYKLTQFAYLFKDSIDSIDINPYIALPKAGKMVDFKVLLK